MILIWLKLSIKLVVNLKFDCIIVLANEMDKLGCLNQQSLDRLNYGISLFNIYNIKNIITCGWDYRTDSDLPIAFAMKLECLKKGINESSILTEINSRDTVGDAFFTKVNFIQKNKWKNVLVVTSGYHVMRTKKIFEVIYGINYNITVLSSERIQDNDIVKSEIKSLNAFYNTFINVESGNDIAILKTILKKHPYYNGKIYSKIVL